MEGDPWPGQGSNLPFQLREGLDQEKPAGGTPSPAVGPASADWQCRMFAEAGVHRKEVAGERFPHRTACAGLAGTVHHKLFATVRHRPATRKRSRECVAAGPRAGSCSPAPKDPRKSAGTGPILIIRNGPCAADHAATPRPAKAPRRSGCGATCAKYARKRRRPARTVPRRATTITATKGWHRCGHCGVGCQDWGGGGERVGGDAR